MPPTVTSTSYVSHMMIVSIGDPFYQPLLYPALTVSHALERNGEREMFYGFVSLLMVPSLLFNVVLLVPLF